MTIWLLCLWKLELQSYTEKPRIYILENEIDPYGYEKYLYASRIRIKRWKRTRQSQVCTQTSMRISSLPLAEANIADSQLVIYVYGQTKTRCSIIVQTMVSLLWKYKCRVQFINYNETNAQFWMFHLSINANFEFYRHASVRIFSTEENEIVWCSMLKKTMRCTNYVLLHYFSIVLLQGIAAHRHEQ